MGIRVGLAGKIGLMLLVQLVSLAVMTGGGSVLLHLYAGVLERVRQEWTLLSFLLYGIDIFPVLGNDEIHGLEAYETASRRASINAATFFWLIGNRRDTRQI